MMHGHIGHVDHHVSSLSSHFREEEAMLRNCESESVEQLARESSLRQAAQNNLNLEKATSCNFEDRTESGKDTEACLA
eukprot:12933957-Prorocentrum_lima.AAC.1